MQLLFTLRCLTPDWRKLATLVPGTKVADLIAFASLVPDPQVKKGPPGMRRWGPVYKETITR